MSRRILDHNAYKIGWICPLEVEQIAAMEMLDEEHKGLPQKPADHNVYKLGCINNHNVVVAGLPQTGNCSAATVVAQMRMTFPNLRYGLLVGIGGGVPVQTDSGIVRLGHVVVSKPTGIHSGVVQYDHGKAIAGQFERTGFVAPPPAILLGAAQALAVERERAEHDPVWKDAQRPQRSHRTARRFKYPGITNDNLYHPDYAHQKTGRSCKEGGCDPKQRVKRTTGDHDESFVVVHRGTIASGELLLRDAAMRDRLAEQHSLLCFEMEAVGALADLPCMVIRGISDYCDTHKNDEWHGYAAAVAAAYARQLFFHLPHEEALDNMQSSLAAYQLPTKISEIFEISRFVAREEELSRMHDHLKGAGRRRTVVLHGLGGIGKTQLAIAYFRRHHEDYSTMIWLNARSETTLQQSFAGVAEQIKRHDPSKSYIAGAMEGRDAVAIVRAVKRWLDEPGNSRWLLIYDNYDHPVLTMSESTGQNDEPPSEQNKMVVEDDDEGEDANTKAFDIRQYLPETDHGAAIVTSRLMVKLGQAIHLNKLRDVNESLEILASTSGDDSIKQDPRALDIARRLDGLPLALATAGAYLAQTSMTCAEYLQCYDESWLQLHRETPQIPSYDRALYSTWNISYQYIQQQSPVAATFLRQCAYFNNEDIWYELLAAGAAKEESGWLVDMTRDKLQFHGIMRILCSHGLVEAIGPTTTTTQKTDSRGYSVHGCVHSWMIHVLNQGFSEDMACRAICCVAFAVPKTERQVFCIVEPRLLAQADKCLEMIRGNAIGHKVVEALHIIGLLYSDTGRFQDAEYIYQRALEGKEKVYGRDNTSTLKTVYNLGILYVDQGRFRDAEDMFQRALDGYKKANGPDDMSTLDTVNNLGILYNHQGRLREAEDMYQRAMNGFQKAYGRDHIATLNATNNLGAVYLDQGRLQDSEDMYQRALDGFEKTYGRDHVSMLDTVHNLGNLYSRQGRLQDAEEMYQRALDGYRKAYGQDHISTLNTLHTFGILCADQGKLQDAEDMYQRALDGYRNIIDPTSILTYVPAINTLQSFGTLYMEQGRVSEALVYYQQALDGAEAVWGRNSERFRDLTDLMMTDRKPENGASGWKRRWDSIKTGKFFSRKKAGK